MSDNWLSNSVSPVVSTNFLYFSKNLFNVITYPDNFSFNCSLDWESRNTSLFAAVSLFWRSVISELFLLSSSTLALWFNSCSLRSFWIFSILSVKPFIWSSYFCSISLILWAVFCSLRTPEDLIVSLSVSIVFLLVSFSFFKFSNSVNLLFNSLFSFTLSFMLWTLSCASCCNCCILALVVWPSFSDFCCNSLFCFLILSIWERKLFISASFTCVALSLSLRLFSVETILDRSLSIKESINSTFFLILVTPSEIFLVFSFLVLYSLESIALIKLMITLISLKTSLLLLPLI